MSMVPALSRLLPRARTLRRTVIVGAVSAAAVLLFAVPALAHITVNPSSAPAGSAAELTFRVPNEEAKAYTVKVDVQIPTDHPIAQLLVKPVIGWSATVKTITLAKPLVTDDGTFTQAVSEVIWSGGKILPGQFQDFSVSADPLPTGISQMVFKAIQTYNNGDVVRWIDVQQPGQPAVDHPAPIITLTTSSKAPVSTVRASAAPVGPGSDGLARWLAVAGLLVALLASLLALMAVRSARRLTAGIGSRAGAPPAPDRVGGAKQQAGDRVLAGAKAPAQRDQKRREVAASARRRRG